VRYFVLSAANCEDVLLSESQLRVRGKGNKIRVLPLASDTLLLLDAISGSNGPSNAAQRSSSLDYCARSGSSRAIFRLFA
jgi:site-specific recombinase XerC